MIERSGPVPVYLQVAEDLTRTVIPHLRSGERLPSEAELAATYGVSRITIRQALAQLVRQGLVVRKQGKGTFVGRSRIHTDLQPLAGFWESLRRQGIHPVTRLLDYGLVTPDPRVHDALKLLEPRALTFMRQYLVEDVPIALARTHFPASLAPILTRELVEIHPSYILLEGRAGLKIGHADLAIRAQPVARDIAKLLGLKPSSTVLVLERITYSLASVPCEHTMFYLRPDAYEFHLTAIPGGLSLTNGVRALQDAE